MLESKIERAVVKYARDKGIVAHKMQGEMGMPDYVFFYNGKTMFIEFKAPSKKPRKFQVYKHKSLKTVGFIVHVVDDQEDGIKIVDLFSLV